MDNFVYEDAGRVGGSSVLSSDVASSSGFGFCSPDDADCFVETALFALPYYLFLLAFPVRMYEIQLIAFSAPPALWPWTTLFKRGCIVVLAGAFLSIFVLVLAESGEYRYIAVAAFLRGVCYAGALYLLALELKEI